MYPPYVNTIYLDNIFVKVSNINRNMKILVTITATSTLLLLSLNIKLHLCLKANYEMVFKYLDLLYILSNLRFVILP